MLMASSELIDIKFKNNKQNLALTQSLKFYKPKRISIWASEKIFIKNAYSPNVKLFLLNQRENMT